MAFLKDHFRVFGMSNEKTTDSFDSPMDSSAAHVLTPEEEQLAKLGYKQEFTRDFSWLSTFSFAFSISGLLATVPYSRSYTLMLIGHFNIPISTRSGRSSCRCMVLVIFLSRATL